MSDLPDYIQRDGQLLATPPIAMPTTLYMFILDADWDKLNALCDAQLNRGGPTVYRPLLPAVMYYCCDACPRPIDDPIGQCGEKDFGFWVPVCAGHYEGPVYVPERVLTYTPYLWVDTGVPLVGGREVFGFPKAIGKLTMPATPNDPARFFVETQVIPKEGPDADVVWRPLVETHHLAGGLWDELKTLWHSGEGILLTVAELIARLVGGHGKLPVADPAFLMSLIREAKGNIPQVFLKQFPDAADGSKACYQAIVEAGIAVASQVKGGFLSGEYGIKVWSYDSHQIVEHLGLRPAERGPDWALMKSLLHGWVQFDARVACGKIIWKRP